jgi:hypothetical protein
VTVPSILDEDGAFQLNLTQEAFDGPGQRSSTKVRVRPFVGPAKPEMIDGNDPTIRRQARNEASVNE